MVKPEIVRRKVAEALSRIAEAEEMLARPPEEFLADKRSRDLASFYLFLAIQECIDLASHWVSDADWGPADDAASAFDILADHHAIDRDLAERMRGAVGLRNLIAHGYPAVDHSRIQSEYREGVASLRELLSAVAAEAGL
jgi:uncharacterized protein YutE (UPF0331/DUF86 family)